MSTDPTTLARRVIDRNEDWEAGDTARTLARAVLAVADLADQIDAYAQSIDGRDPSPRRVNQAKAVAARIRDALNGDKA